jgi:hypothetical protein
MASILFYAIELCYLSNAHEEKLQTLIGRVLRGGYNLQLERKRKSTDLISTSSRGESICSPFFIRSRRETIVKKDRFFDAKNKYLK